MRISIAIYCAVLTGCYGINPVELRTHGDSAVVTVEQSPEVVFRRIVQGSQQCFPGVLETIGNYFPDTRTGSVYASLRMGGVASTVYSLDIEPSTNRSLLKLSTHKSWPKMTDNVRAWATTGSRTACDIP